MALFSAQVKIGELGILLGEHRASAWCRGWSCEEGKCSGCLFTPGFVRRRPGLWLWQALGSTSSATARKATSGQQLEMKRTITPPHSFETGLTSLWKSFICQKKKKKGKYEVKIQRENHASAKCLQTLFYKL